MARQTGECLAEVTFETASGKYRCMWSQHRKKRQAGAELQDARREIVDATTNTILETHQKRVETKIEELTGMDFQRFTRSMMLAQGGFDAFLKACPSERAPILEQITGTEIYTNISIRVFERMKHEVKTLEDLQSRLAEIQLLTEEEEKSHALEYREKSEESAKLAQTLKTLNENKTWRSEVNRFLLHVQALEQNWNIYIAEEKAAQTDLKRLDQALKALNYAGDYRDLCSLKKLQKDDLEIRSNEMAKKSRLEASLIEKNQALQSHQKNLDDLLEEQKCLSEILKQVREIDKEAQQERRKLQALSEQMSKEENNAAILKKSVEDHQTRQKSYEAQLISIQDYFDRSACDATLVEKFSSIKENIDRFKSKKNIIEEKQKEYTSCLGRLAEAKKQADEDRKSVEAAKAASDNSKNALQVLVDDCALISEGKDALRWDEERKALDQQEKLFAELSKSVELHKDSENTRKKIRMP